MSLKCRYYENDKVNIRFEFECFPGIIFKPKHFKSHAYKYQYDEALQWANKSGGEWNKTGIFLTAYIDSLWKGMPDNQRNTIFPKVHIMWTAVDGTTDDSIPSWMDIAAGYEPLVKQYGLSDGVGLCWFLGNENDISVFFDIVQEEQNDNSNSPQNSDGMIIHIVCPHCGKRIF